MFAGQFVPLKLTTDGNREWSRWARQYPIEGRGIPRLYVIRADGKQLHGKVGAPQGDALPRLLSATLRKSGRSFNDAQAALLKSKVEAAESALATQNYGRAAAELSKLSELGALGGFGSYARPALKADRMVRGLITTAESMVSDAVADLEQVDTAFAGALALTEVQRQFSRVGNVQQSVTAVLKSARRNSTRQAYVAQAQAVSRARRLAESEQARIRRGAAQAYETVIRRFPGTEADEIARRELAVISPNAEILSSKRSTTRAMLRKWTDASGRFSLRATLVKVERGRVTLKKENGGEITIDLQRLSSADQEFLRRTVPGPTRDG